MSKELEALNRLFSIANMLFFNDINQEEDYKLVKAALKREDSIEITAIDIEQENQALCKENKKLRRALETIKEKIHFMVYQAYFDNRWHYFLKINNCILPEIELTETEYTELKNADLIKEVLS